MKKLLTIAVLFIGLVLVATPVFAKGKNGPAGKSNKAHLYLYEKDPSNWSIVEDGAWGKMTYDQSGEEFNFVFNGHGLMPETEYTLIYYPDPWPGDGLICMGHGTSNKGGNINIKDYEDIEESLPIDNDENEGAKIWLVLSDDVKCEENSKMDAWNPTEYLFEYDLINFDYTEMAD